MVDVVVLVCNQHDQGREKEALESVEKGLKLEQHVSVYCQKIDILGTFGRFDEAFELIKHAETLLPEEFDQMHVMYHLTVGVTLHKQGTMMRFWGTRDLTNVYRKIRTSLRAH